MPKRARKSKKPRRDHHQEITDRMVAALESVEPGEAAPWQRPWKWSRYGSTPRNAVTGRPYRGINIWLTLMTQWERAYDTPLWLTFNQAHEVAAKAARKAGHKVEAREVGRKYKKTVYVFADGPNKGKSVGGIREGQNAANGSGATTVILWKPVKKKETDDNGEESERSWMMMRAYTVFNISQCDDHVREYLCPPDEEVPEFQPLEECERICEGFDVETKHGGDQACYFPAFDRIHMPERHQFKTPEHYYTTRFHEMGHATGHSSRLNRFKSDEYRARHEYAAEELVAEFTACFLAGEAGIIRTVENNSAAYLRHWASKLKEDKTIVVTAAQRAQKAADLILGRQPTAGASDAEEDSEAA